jgi:hypothetical protein
MELVNEVISKVGTVTKNQKQYLTLIRQLTLIHVEDYFDTNSDLFKSLVHLINALPDTDVERKITRAGYLLLTMMTQRNDSSLKTSVNVIEYLSTLRKELINQHGARCCLGWRLLSICAINFDIIDSYAIELHHKIMSLKYPVKQKVLLGQSKIDKEFRNSLDLWSTLLSCMHRLKYKIPNETYDNIIIASTSIHNLSLVRHSLGIINLAITKDPNILGPIFLNKLYNNAYNEYAFSDVICCIYIIKICTYLITSANISTKDINNIKDLLLKFMNDDR